MTELLPCPFQLWDEVEVKTGEGQPDWCGDWVNAPTLFVVGIDYNFKKSRYELTVAENKKGQYLTDEMPADCMRLVFRADKAAPVERIPYLSEAIKRLDETGEINRHNEEAIEEAARAYLALQGGE